MKCCGWDNYSQPIEQTNCNFKISCFKSIENLYNSIKFSIIIIFLIILIFNLIILFGTIKLLKNIIYPISQYDELILNQTE